MTSIAVITLVFLAGFLVLRGFGRTVTRKLAIDGFGLGNVDNLVVGFFLVTIGYTLVSIVFTGAWALFLFGGLSILVGVFSIWSIKHSGLSGYFRLTLIETVPFIAIATLALLNLLDLRFHASPDIYGFASAVGYFTDDLSYQNLQADYMNATGLNSPDWLGNIPGITNLDAPWNIGDARLRFTSDLVLGSGRLGCVLVIALFGKLFGAFTALAVALPIMMIFTAWVTAHYGVQIFLKVFVSLNKALDGKKLLLVSAIANIVLVFSPVSQLLITEGALPQFWTLAALSWQIYVGLNLYGGQASSIKLKPLLLLVPGPLFVATSYGTGLLLLAPATALVFLGAIRLKKPYGGNIWKLLTMGVFVILPGVALAWYLNRYTFIAVISAFLASGTGAPYNPGYLSITSGLFQFGTGLNYLPLNSAGGGFTTDQNFIQSAQIQWAVLVVILALALVGLIRKRKIKIQLFLYLAFSLLLALQSIRLLFPAEPVSTYFYIRSFMNWVVVGLPIMAALIFAALPVRTIRRMYPGMKPLAYLVLIIQLPLALSQSYSARASSIPILPELRNFQDNLLNTSLIVSSVPDHRVFGLGLFGPVYYLSDNWEPKFSPVLHGSKIKNVLFVDLESENPITVIGTITIDGELSGPVAVDELAEFSEFVPNKEYVKVLAQK